MLHFVVLNLYAIFVELKTGVAATDALNKVDKSLKLVFLWPPRGRGQPCLFFKEPELNTPS